MAGRSITSSNGARAAEGGCALVTGGGRGIGAAIAAGLAADGWPIAINYNESADGAQAGAARIEADGGRALAVQADVADSGEVGAMFDRVEEELGTVLVLVNNAGIRHDRLIGGLDEESWTRVLGVNLHGAYNTLHRGIGPMVRRRFGRVVNISTISAQTGLPGQSAYAASKAGVEALTRTVAIEMARRGITSNAVAPGLVTTDFVPEMTDEWAEAVPANRAASPEEVAACVRFLASDDAAYVNGAVIRMDGALTAGIGMLVRREKSGAKRLSVVDE
jgi:3-oxoacyl-[acyl-carrier protein] reductase